MLKSGSAIVMASEDLFISEEKVRVKYRFENPTGSDVRTTVAFPRPPSRARRCGAGIKIRESRTGRVSNSKPGSTTRRSNSPRWSWR